MEVVKKLAQLLLGVALTFAGTTHLGSNRQEFRAQVPTWLPLDPDFVVIASGFVEISLGLSLIITLLIFKRYRRVVGLITALFFAAIFPGNLNQYINQIDAFGLDSDQKRLIRLFFQPPLVIWALWSSEATSLVRQLLKASW